MKIQSSLPGEDGVLAPLYDLLARGTGQLRFRKLDSWQELAPASTGVAPNTKAAA